MVQGYEFGSSGLCPSFSDCALMVEASTARRTLCIDPRAGFLGPIINNVMLLRPPPRSWIGALPAAFGLWRLKLRILGRDRLILASCNPLLKLKLTTCCESSMHFNSWCCTSSLLYLTLLFS